MIGQQNSDSLYERVINGLEERRNNIIQGNINSIPSPFPRFSNDFIGIEQGKYYLITSYTKGSKTQCTSFMFLYNALMYAFKHPDKIRVKIFYYPLEETPKAIMERFMCHLLYVLSNGSIEIAPVDLRSTKNDKPLSPEIIEILRSEKYKSILKFFEENVIFGSVSNPTGIFNECKKYAKENGVIHTVKKKYKDDFGVLKEADAFDWYEPNDPQEYRLVLVDHISLLSNEAGMSTKQTMDRFSEYMVDLRNKYNFSPLVIQQQSVEGEGIDNFKEGKLRPTIKGLADSKYTGRDANMCLGLFSPAKYDLREYLGYDITKFKDNIRFLEVIINRDGPMGGITALYFNGAVNHFEELPKPNDTVALEGYYNRIKKSKGLLFFSKGKQQKRINSAIKVVRYIAQVFKFKK